jgi:hypothetical protein
MMKNELSDEDITQFKKHLDELYPRINFIVRYSYLALFLVSFFFGGFLPVYGSAILTFAISLYCVWLLKDVERPVISMEARKTIRKKWPEEIKEAKEMYYFFAILFLITVLYTYLDFSEIFYQFILKYTYQISHFNEIAFGVKIYQDKIDEAVFAYNFTLLATVFTVYLGSKFYSYIIIFAIYFPTHCLRLQALFLFCIIMSCLLCFQFLNEYILSPEFFDKCQRTGGCGGKYPIHSIQITYDYIFNISFFALPLLNFMAQSSITLITGAVFINPNKSFK